MIPAENPREAPPEADLPGLADTIAAEAARLPGRRYDRPDQLESAKYLRRLVDDLIAGLSRGYRPCPQGCPADDCLAYEKSGGSVEPCERWEPDPDAEEQPAALTTSGQTPACLPAIPDTRNGRFPR